MSEREPPAREPERLLHDRRIGKLISQANGVYRARLDESGAFQRLSERLERPRRSWRWQGLTLGAVLSAAAGVVMMLGMFDDASFGRALFREALFDDGQNRVALGPELSAGRRVLRDGRESPEPGRQPVQEVGTEALAAPADVQRASATAEAKPALREPDGSRPPVSPARERQVARGEASGRSKPSLPNTAAETQVVAPRELAARPEPERANGTGREQNGSGRLGAQSADGASKGALDGITRADVEHASGDGKGAAPTMASDVVGASAVEAPSSAARAVEARLDCSDLLEKDARAAEHCYVQRAAESSGLSAEVALYELARLRRNVQDDAPGALAALNQYRDRFPRGSLRNEVGLTRVELLSELGRGREALNEAEALLGSAKGGERAAELHLLRGNIFRRDLADFAQAAQEYSKAEKFGGSFGAEATRLRGLSLEALGDVEGALAAYRRYLSGPDQLRKDDVRRRIEALTSSQRGATP